MHGGRIKGEKLSTISRPRIICIIVEDGGLIGLHEWRTMGFSWRERVYTGVRSKVRVDWLKLFESALGHKEEYVGGTRIGSVMTGIWGKPGEDLGKARGELGPSRIPDRRFYRFDPSCGAPYWLGREGVQGRVSK